jgi:hypothetical protein
VDAGDGVAACEPIEHGGDVGFRIEAVQLRGFGDGVDDRSALPAYIREVAIMRLSFLVRATGRVRIRNVLAGARATTPIGPGLAERGRP